ncbi:M42 family metallopeptidase [Clostridium thermarum]|uniref:M42 family metallopeptidase n=1 Tax=Clostridium thermarum TaxID=1716543 RepID=UPI0013D3B131|nr:M42 family metallopeptidase [Clostridium thermarum]
MNFNRDRFLHYLRNLIAIGSPSGYTHKVMKYIEKELTNLGVPYEVTNKGAIVVSFDGENKDYQRTFSAHVDTLGAMVKLIKSNGALSFIPIGGFLMASVEGENCVIETQSGKTFSGTIQSTKPSVHISGSDATDLKRVPENMEIILDEKVFSKADVESLGINVGDFVCIDTRFTVTESGFIKSRYLDDKASAAALLYCIEHIKTYSLTLPHTVNFFISNYEEVGHGATAGIPENTREFIAVDMGAPGLDQNSSEYAVCICAKDSSGPYDYDLRSKLIDICIKEEIPYKVDIYPFYGSDASAALRAGWDVKTALIGPGVFASHGYERTHMESLEATTRLVLNYCCK